MEYIEHQATFQDWWCFLGTDAEMAVGPLPLLVCQLPIGYLKLKTLAREIAKNNILMSTF